MQKRIAIFCLIIILFSSFVGLLEEVNAVEPSISYQTHIKDFGWINTVSNGQTGGTTGQAKRMEAIKINLNGIDGILKYQVHVEDYGWMKEVRNGQIAGTTGQAKRMEAIIIKLENSSYNIKYRVHTRDIGWMDWKTSGQIAGTTGQCRRIEAIQIVVEKNTNKIEEQIVEIVPNDSVIEKEIVENNVSNNGVNKERYFGIDVSKYQGEIDWTKVKKSEVDFAMIRCAYRGYTAGSIIEDLYFERNIKEAYKNGIKVGLYFYSSAINEQEAVEEANYVLNLLNKYNVKNSITYPITIDIEDFEGTRNYNLTVQERTNVAKAFCNTIKNAGYIPMVYSYTYFLSTKLDMNQLINYDTWIADYHGNTWYKGNYSIWQYTDNGVIDGIPTKVDLNYCYKNY